MSERGSRTHYEVLGVSADAPFEAIRLAYRARAKASHPDAGGDQADFVAVREAFDVLANPLARRDYDARIGVQPGVRWDARSPEDPEGWSGPQGDFTGDVEFPAYLRDLTDQAWARRTAPLEEETVPPRPATVLWSWPQHAIRPPVVSGALVVALLADAVVALDLLTGREVWRAGLPARPVCRPVVIGDTVVVWTDDAVLHGLELGRGTTRWEARVGPVCAAPLIAQDDAVLLARGDGLVGTVAAADGAYGWSTKVLGIPSALAAGAGTAVVVTNSTVLTGIELRHGRQRWRSRTSYPVDLPPVVLADDVWVSSGRASIQRMSLDTGATTGTWQSSTAIAGACTDGRRLYVTVAGPAQLVAIEPSGTVRWAVGVEEVSPEPDVSGDWAVLAEPNGMLCRFGLTDGTLEASAALPVEPVGAPIAAGDRVILQERNGRVWCLEAPTS